MTRTGRRSLLVILTFAAFGCESALNLGHDEGADKDADAGRVTDFSPTETIDATPAADEFDAGSADVAEASVVDASCEGVCGKLVKCGYAKTDEYAQCVDECSRAAQQHERECIAANACANIQSACAEQDPDTFAIRICQDSCDSAKFNSCFDAAKHANCRALCASKPAAVRDSYQSCARSAGGDCPEHLDCYQQFEK
ncbi:MAG TPA: hypothetical protein VM925_30515 [Labilithrix sp.]|nr:hypothetical protein [Labilithrix sp.]